MVASRLERPARCIGICCRRLANMLPCRDLYPSGYVYNRTVGLFFRSASRHGERARGHGN